MIAISGCHFQVPLPYVNNKRCSIVLAAVTRDTSVLSSIKQLLLFGSRGPCPCCGSVNICNGVVLHLIRIMCGDYVNNNGGSYESAFIISISGRLPAHISCNYFEWYYTVMMLLRYTHGILFTGLIKKRLSVCMPVCVDVCSPACGLVSGLCSFIALYLTRIMHAGVIICFFLMSFSNTASIVSACMCIPK